MAGRQRDDLFAAADEECIVRQQQPAYLLADERREGRIEVVIVADAQQTQFLPRCVHRLPDVRQLCFGLRTAWVHKTGNARLRTKLAQQFQSLRGQRARENGHASDVTPRPVEASDEAELDRVASDDENDRDS